MFDKYISDMFYHSAGKLVPDFINEMKRRIMFNNLFVNS